MSKKLNHLLKTPLWLPLHIGAVCERVAFEIKYKHFHALELVVPLSHNFGVPVTTLDSFYSFSEMFISGEYGDFLERMPLPDRWLDIGCHTGYFSLFLAWQRAVRGGRSDYEALLVDADPRMALAAGKTIEVNRLQSRLHFVHGAIGSHPGYLSFALRPGMESGIATDAGQPQELVGVPVLTAEDILRRLPPPYDLLKIDVEGAEVDFLEHYGAVYQQARWILLEWHAEDLAGSQQASLTRTLEKAGFTLERIIKPLHATEGAVVFKSAGINLYRKT